jgi:uncharacterized RDD family membrane protein YckC
MTGDVHVTGRRIIATWIDLFVLGIGYRVLASPLSLPMDYSGGDFASRMAHRSPELFVYVVVAGAYYLVLEGLWGRTLGKMVTGIRVVTDTGDKPGLGRIFGRTLLRPIDAIGGYLLAFLVAVFSVRRQRIGDHAAGTLVVRV